MNFFRVQRGHYTLDEMKNYETFVDYNDEGEDIRVKGLCACISPDGLDGGSAFGGAWDAMDDDDEVVILKGHIIQDIYDGVIIEPTEEIGRFTISEWSRKLKDGTAWDYEDWD